MGPHGWWQVCPEQDGPGYDPFGPDGANYNLIIGNDAIDPVSGSVPHRAYRCLIRAADQVCGARRRPEGPPYMAATGRPRT
jgi:hypothetical protein